MTGYGQWMLSNFSRKRISVNPKLPCRDAYVPSILGNRFAEEGRFKFLHGHIKRYLFDDQFGDELFHLFSHLLPQENSKVPSYHSWGTNQSQNVVIWMRKSLWISC